MSGNPKGYKKLSFMEAAAYLEENGKVYRKTSFHNTKLQEVEAIKPGQKYYAKNKPKMVIVCTGDNLVNQDGKVLHLTGVEEVCLEARIDEVPLEGRYMAKPDKSIMQIVFEHIAQ